MSTEGDTMRAAIYRRRGEAHEVLEVVDLPVPAPGPGEVRVRIHVSGVNPTDWKARTGSDPLPFPFQVPNQDGAGVIVAAGPGVDPSRVGQRVWVYFAARRRQFGTAAGSICLPSAQAVHLPDAASFELGASLGIPALTAHRCLFADGDIGGRTVLVAGGAGAVGRAAIELARRAGATVVATVSSEEKAGLAREAGADHVVNYREEGAAGRILQVAPGGIDRIVEVSPEANLRLDLEVAAPNASIAIYATDLDPTIPVGEMMQANLVLRFVLVYTMSREALGRAVAEVNDAVSEGALTVLPLHRFTLDRIADAHDAVEQGAVGKVIVDLAP